MPTYSEAVGEALRRELGQSRRAIKTAMRWTGASERTVKYWLAGTKSPGSEHLLHLLMHSNAVFGAVMRLINREPLTQEHQLMELRYDLIELLAFIDARRRPDQRSEVP